MLKIEKKKILYFPFKESKQYRNLTRVKGSVFNMMNDHVEIDSDVTFGDFFKFLIAEKDLVQKIFSASLCGVPFELLIDDFKKKPKKFTGEIKYLELYWSAELGDNELNIETDLHGIPKKRKNKDFVPIALDFVPLNELITCQLVLNKNFEITNNNTIKQKDISLFKAIREFTLYEIIHAVLNELTWYGTPEMRDKKGKAILQDIKKIRTVDDLIETDIFIRSLRENIKKSYDKKHY